MRFQFKKAAVYFAWSYIVVTILAYSTSWLAGIIFKLPSYQQLGVGLFKDPAFVMTVPYHILINILCWSFFSFLFLKKKTGTPGFLKDCFRLGSFWLVTAMMVDLVFFVLIKSPVSLTTHQFYIEYQPWISITYLTVFAGPLIAYVILKRKRQG